jgi:hypothetical protein
MFPGFWKETDEKRRNWMIAKFDIIKETRVRLWNLALAIKVKHALLIFCVKYVNMSVLQKAS